MPKKQTFSSIPVRKTGTHNEKLKFEDKFASVTTTPIIMEQHDRLTKRLQKLHKALLRYSFIWSKGLGSYEHILRKYIQCYYEYYQFDQFDKEVEILPSLDVNLYAVSNEDIIYKSYNIFQGCTWPIRFHSKFASKLGTFSQNQILYTLSFIMLLAEGKFYGRKTFDRKDKGEYGWVTPVLNTKSIAHNRQFLMKIFREKNIIFNIGVQKVPIIKNDVIKRYEFVNYIQILDLVSDQVVSSPQKIEETVNRFIDYLRQDVAKEDHSEFLVIEQSKQKFKKKVTYHFFEEKDNPYLNTKQVFMTDFEPTTQNVYSPIVFKPFYVGTTDNSTIIFDKNLKRWVAKDYLDQREQKALNQYQRKVNQELIKRFIDFQSAKTLVELLTKIPNFKVELTDQQKDVIGENGNVLAIGRSGTGKTTCAVLRLFAIEMLFKIRLSLSKKKFQGQLRDTRCSADDIDKTIGLHCVFLTASPVLTNEIQRYYKKLTENIKVELEKKRKRAQEERKKQENEEFNMMKKKEEPHEQPAQQVMASQYEEIVEKNGDQDLEVPETLQVKKSKEAIEEEQEMNNQLGGIKLDETIGNEKFEEEQEENFDQLKDQMNQKMKKFKSLDDLTEEDYPGFFTVKSFIMMIDGTLSKPFFIRKQESNEEESQATWHNEKKGVMMIENYYRNQSEEQKEEVIQEQQIQEEINYSDQEQLEHEYLRQVQLRENKQKQKLTQKFTKNKKALSFEVDYDYFSTYFWPTVRHKHYSARNINSHLVWTEIYSTIKGGASAHLYPGMYMPEKVYIDESANSFLTKQQKLDVYETFCQYERWKINAGGYDMIDAVNYILNFIRFRGYTGPDIHYVMIDQVQDLPHAVIYLLSKTAKYGVFYSGDTAQTIAKGIGFRFCDLKNMFKFSKFDYSLQLAPPVVKQLTVNFRSHNNILQLANSVVSSIEILFPKTIDRLKKQVSNLQGPKPMILAEGNQQLLFYVLCGDESYKKVAEQDQGLKKPPLQFGCDQVIIVRDQESKNKVPSMLQHALCLTIYQAKGLEFNDVILFNFFTQSKCSDKWNLIKFLRVITQNIDRQEYERNLTLHSKNMKKQKSEKVQANEGEVINEKQVEPEVVDVECIVESKNNKINIKKIVSDAKIVMKDINDYAELCSELKMLYTAITRPKNTLIIYDEDASARKTIEKLWEKLDVVQLISKELLQQANKKNKNQSEQINIFKKVVNSTNGSEWKKQGLKMYSRGFFEQAMKCFEKSGNPELFLKAEANYKADKATKKLIEIQSERNAIKNKLVQYQKMNQSDLSKLRKNLKKQEAHTFVQFEEAAKIFEELLMFKQAGQCYFSGRKYEKAYENFSKAFMYKQAGQSLEMHNKYREAAECYEREGLYLKTIQCLDMVNEWNTILKVIQKFSNQMTDLEKKSLYKKYSALALQELVYEIQFENEPEEFKPENNRVQVIKQEEQSQEEDDWDSSEDPEVAAERALNRKNSEDIMIASRKQSNVSLTSNQPQRKSSVISQDKIIKESVYENIQRKEEQKVELPSDQINRQVSNQSSSFADLNQSEQQPQPPAQDTRQVLQSVHQPIQVHQPNQMIESVYEPAQSNQQQQDPDQSSGSFADLNSYQSSFADLNSQHEDYNTKYPAELEPDLQSIKSLADPEDPWVRSALSEIQARTNTEYSIIGDDENYNSNVRIIKTKGNIVVQDQIMKKIVGIVSILNQSVEEFFKQFKGYQSLFTISNTLQNQDIVDNRPEISQFEDIDPKFINIILDTLQSFKLHKLCLFVCNRYHLPHKAGRYLVSMALKYATNSQINNTLSPALIAPSITRKSELEKGILASIALHTMFENVSSDFLKVKVCSDEKKQAKNSLGSYFIEGLIIEGLYKKAVFMVNPEESLKILKNFCDLEVYQQVFKQKFLKKAPEDPAEWLEKAPATKLEQEYTIVKLEEILSQYNVINRVDTVSVRFYKEFSLVQIRNKFNPQGIRPYLPIFSALVSEDKTKLKNVLKDEISKYCQYIQNGPSFKIFEIVSFLTTLINNEKLYEVATSLPASQFLDLFHILRSMRRVLRKKHKPRSYDIIQAILSVYMCRMIDPSMSSKFINDGFAFVHRTSNICNEFIEELKKNKEETAFFFEQDYNYILVKTNKLLDVICKRFDMAYSKFLRIKIDLRNIANQWENRYFAEDYQTEQTEHLIRGLLREQIRLMANKHKKIKVHQVKKVKKQKPKFNFKNQGRPQLMLDPNDFDTDSEQQDQQNKQSEFVKQAYNLFIFPDLHPKLARLTDLAISSFNQKINENRSGKMISGRALYCCGSNDSYKEHIHRRKHDTSSDNLYNAIEFRKFNRLDLYADNILSVYMDLSYAERQLFSLEIIVHLIVQYHVLAHGSNFKLQVPRNMLKFLPGLKFVEVIGAHQDKLEIDSLLEQNQKICAFSYRNLFSSEYQEPKEVLDVINEFLQMLKTEASFKCFNIEQMMMLLLINIPQNEEIYNNLTDFVSVTKYNCTNRLLAQMIAINNYKEYQRQRSKLLSGENIYNSLSLFHEIRVTDHSNIDRDIKESEKDYEIKQKILNARVKAVHKIQVWWRSLKNKHSSLQEIVRENRIIRITHNVKRIPLDDYFILRSSNIREKLIAFYLKNVVTSSLDFHFILMTLNQIEDLRRKYIKAYSGQPHGFVQLEQEPIDFEQEIIKIEDTVKVWITDEKWLKERNVYLKRKKVFEVKWMTKNAMHKLTKKRAGLKKQKQLQKKKEILKRIQG